MKINLILATIIAALIYNYALLAQPASNEQNNAPVYWTAKPGQDIKIENGNGANLSIQITVQGSDTSPGITIHNCGTTTSIKAGSSAICTSTDPLTPVTFTTDDLSNSAKGAYQVKHK